MQCKLQIKKRKEEKPMSERTKETVSSPKNMTLYDYRVLRDALKRCVINVTSDKSEEEMGGHLHAFLDYLCPVKGIGIYDVDELIETVRKVRELYQAKNNLVFKTEQFIEAIEDEIARLEKEKNEG